MRACVCVCARACVLVCVCVWGGGGGCTCRFCVIQEAEVIPGTVPQNLKLVSCMRHRPFTSL